MNFIPLPSFFRRKPKGLTDLEWFESLKFGTPSLFRSPSNFIWHAEMIQFGKHIRGKGKTMAEAISDCRRNYDAEQEVI